MKHTQLFLLLTFFLTSLTITAQSVGLQSETIIEGIEQKVIDWRRDIHENPELGNREVRTAALVTKHLESLGMDVQTKVGVTGVIGVLKGGLPGPVIALRADMDALPIEAHTRFVCVKSENCL